MPVEKTELTVRVGLKRKPKAIFDEIDCISAAMIRDGWSMHESFLDDSFSAVRLIFKREIED